MLNPTMFLNEAAVYFLVIMSIYPKTRTIPGRFYRNDCKKIPVRGPTRCESRKKKTVWQSYNKIRIDWPRSGWTGKYLALSRDARTSLRSVGIFLSGPPPTQSIRAYSFVESAYAVPFQCCVTLRLTFSSDGLQHALQEKYVRSTVRSISYFSSTVFHHLNFNFHHLSFLLARLQL